MRIAVLGGGVVGVAAAWYLASDGHDVTLVDRQPGVALETSFANGGQISASHAEPWANPGAPRKILRWLGQPDAPLLFRLRPDWRQWQWGLQFLCECLPSRTRRNTIQCLTLALYSLACLRALRASIGLEYAHAERGILQIYSDAREFDEAVAFANAVRQYGSIREGKTADECVAIEPALAHYRSRLAGGIFTPGDESGDAHAFTVALAKAAAARGVTPRFGTTVDSLVPEGDRIGRVTLFDASGRTEDLHADGYVVALGSYSPFVLSPVGVPCNVYPAKGYSATIDIGEHGGAPNVSLTDTDWKIVISRLGDRLRVAGTAELDGWNVELNRTRCEALAKRTFELFPDAGSRENIRYWAGLRPATPSNVPLIGRTRYRNLWLDTGHGTLGFTMACGSGRALADIIGGRTPAVPFEFL